MALRFDTIQIKNLMRSFYTLSGIRFTLFDTDFHEVISYPDNSCDFCRLMKGCPKTRRKCNYADRRSFEACEKGHSLVLYTCHAGLVEAAMPLHENEKIIGYLMFGQITDTPDKEALYHNIPYWSQRYSLDEDALRQAIQKIACKSEEEIRSAAQIMEACTSYIIYKELITPQSNQILEAAKAYIETHLDEEISIADLCRDLQVSRTKLYEIFRADMKQGISKYILRRRMHRAKKLLKTTELSVPEVADSVNFPDYNYFSRVFKKIYGISPTNLRKQTQA